MATRESVVRVRVDTDASGASSKLGRFAGFAGKAALGVGLLAVGAAAGAKKIYEIGDASDDANARIAQINKSMGLFGKETSSVTDRITKYAEAIGRQTGIDANSIKATQAKLLTFKELGKTADDVGGNFDRATKAAIDMAAAGFGSAETNAVQLGKALQDPIKGLTALGRSGVTFTEQEKERIATLVESNRMGEAQALVLKAIETQVGGTAEATAGGFERMKETFRQGGDALAKQFLPYMDKFGNFMVDKGLPAIKEFGAELQARFGPALKQVGEFIQERVIPAARQFNEWFVEKIAPGIKRAVTPVIDGAREAFEKIRDKIEDNREPLGKLFDAFKKIAEFVADKILPIFGKQFGDSVEKLGTAIGIAIEALGKLISFWDKVGRSIGTAIDKLREFNGMSSGHGGVYTPSTPSAPPGSGGGSGGNPNAVDRGRGGVQVIVQGNVLGTSRELQQTIEQALRRAGVGRGGLVV